MVSCMWVESVSEWCRSRFDWIFEQDSFLEDLPDERFLFRIGGRNFDYHFVIVYYYCVYRQNAFLGSRVPIPSDY
jgi:hypothetical protein